MSSFATETQDFATVIDFIRFGISKASSAELCYGHGTDNATDDIFALILDTLHLPSDVDYRLLAGRVTPTEQQRLVASLERRILERVPVPYITHCAYFCGQSFYVDERVLIPRSPLAELIAQQFTPWVAPDALTRILDLCTGSACIAIACAYAFPAAQVDAVDLSLDALAVARINRDRHHMQDQLHLIASDCFDQVPAHLYDIIVSNPPYVSSAQCALLPAEYQHEPELALLAAEEGLAVVNRILHQAAQYLTPQGILIVEVGLSAEALVALYPDLPFVWLDFAQGGEGVFLLTARQLRAYFQG